MSADGMLDTLKAQFGQITKAEAVPFSDEITQLAAYAADTPLEELPGLLEQMQGWVASAYPGQAFVRVVVEAEQVETAARQRLPDAALRVDNPGPGPILTITGEGAQPVIEELNALLAPLEPFWQVVSGRT